MARVVVIGGGMSGLSFAKFLKEMKPGWEVVVLEAEKRAGGKAWTDKEGGFLCERGVNGVLDNKPSTLNLAKSLGLAPLRSNDAARKRFVVKKGVLEPLPESPPSFLFSSLLSPFGRLRVLMEPFIPKGDMDKDESLADFARRRLGNDAFKWLIDPMATGIYAGDPEKLSLKSCFPRIHELERDYGSLIRAMLRLQQEARKKGGKGPGAGPGGTLTSFTQGMSELTEALSTALKKDLHLGQRVKHLEKKGSIWQVVTESGDIFEATHVVLSCPAPSAAKILEGNVPEISHLASKIYYPPVSVVCFGVRTDSVASSLNGFGFLCPGCERRKILGTLWDSSIFSGRAPNGYALLRSLVGGARAPRLAELDDESLAHLVQKELRDLVGLKKEPEFVRIYKWKEAIPQYNIGHGKLEKELAASLKKFGSLYVRCNWVGGVSLNDCVANGYKLAQEIAI